MTTAIERCIHEQQLCREYLDSDGPDKAGAMEVAKDWIMEEAIIRTEYTEFLKSKRNIVSACGPTVEPGDIHMAHGIRASGIRMVAAIRHHLGKAKPDARERY